VDVGRPIVTNWEFVAYSCAKVREAIELPFGVVSEVSPETGVLDGVNMPKGKERF